MKCLSRYLSGYLTSPFVAIGPMLALASCWLLLLGLTRGDAQDVVAGIVVTPLVSLAFLWSERRAVSFFVHHMPHVGQLFLLPLICLFAFDLCVVEPDPRPTPERAMLVTGAGLAAMAAMNWIGAVRVVASVWRWSLACVGVANALSGIALMTFAAAGLTQAMPPKYAYLVSLLGILLPVVLAILPGAFVGIRIQGRSVNHYVDRLKEGTAQWRIAAAYILATVIAGERRSVEIGLLKQDRWNSRDPDNSAFLTEVIPALKSATADEVAIVRSLAAEALSFIGPAELGTGGPTFLRE